jgi:hypothetical protein
MYIHDGKIPKTHKIFHVVATFVRISNGSNDTVSTDAYMATTSKTIHNILFRRSDNTILSSTTLPPYTFIVRRRIETAAGMVVGKIGSGRRSSGAVPPSKSTAAWFGRRSSCAYITFCDSFGMKIFSKIYTKATLIDYHRFCRFVFW